MKDWRVSLISHDGNGVQYVNTLCAHVQQTVLDLADLGASDVASAVDTWLRTKYRDVLAAAYTFDEIQVRELFTETPAEAASTVGLAGTLTPGSGQLPREVCMVLSFKSDVATRSGRGRIFIPSPQNSSYLVAPDTWSTSGAYWTNVGALGAQLLTGQNVTFNLIDYHVSLRIHSRKHNATYDVKSYLRRPAPHWLRSRSTAP